MNTVKYCIYYAKDTKNAIDFLESIHYTDIVIWFSLDADSIIVYQGIF